MDRSFSLADLVPEPLYFVDNAVGGDGTRYEVLTSELLSERDIATATRLDARIRQMQNDPAASLEALNDYMQMLVPDMPRERVTAIPMAFKVRFMTWWSQKQQDANGPKPKAAQD